MPVTFVVVPEWQASGSDRAMRLVDGAEAIRGDLPSASTHSVNVPLEAGDSEGSGVNRASSIRLVAERSSALLTGVVGPAITIGGDCGVALGAVNHANVERSGDLAVIWFDAHPDLNSPSSSPSGNFGGMVLRAILGDGIAGLVANPPVDPSRVVLAGTRAFDAAEDEYIAANEIAVLPVEQLDSSDALLAAIAATGATAVYIHVDVDVLDPGEVEGLGNPMPFGLSAVQLISLIKSIKAEYEFAGASIAQFAPASPADALDDLPTLLRIIGALAT
jgi:arginase